MCFEAGAEFWVKLLCNLHCYAILLWSKQELCVKIIVKCIQIEHLYFMKLENRWFFEGYHAKSQKILNPYFINVWYCLSKGGERNPKIFARKRNHSICCAIFRLCHRTLQKRIWKCPEEMAGTGLFTGVWPKLPGIWRCGDQQFAGELRQRIDGILL